MAAATPGEWVTEFDPIDAGDHATAVCLPGKAGEIGTFLAYCQHNWNEAGYSERRISWKEATTNAALIVAARNSAPALLTEIRELRAENARLREALGHAQGRFLNINIALSSGGTKREAIRIADVGEDCAKNAIARAALGEPQ